MIEKWPEMYTLLLFQPVHGLFKVKIPHSRRRKRQKLEKCLVMRNDKQTEVGIKSHTCLAL